MTKRCKKDVGEVERQTDIETDKETDRETDRDSVVYHLFSVGGAFRDAFWTVLTCWFDSFRSMFRTDVWSTILTNRFKCPSKVFNHIVVETILDLT